MTTTTEIERFQRDHATPEAVAAFFSGLGPDASREAIASAFQAGGYAITPSDLSDLTKDDRSGSLSDQDLDGVCGGISVALRRELGIMTGGKSEEVFRYYSENYGINIHHVSRNYAIPLMSHNPKAIEAAISQSREGRWRDI